jgi:hypothetical protein
MAKQTFVSLIVWRDYNLVNVGSNLLFVYFRVFIRHLYQVLLVYVFLHLYQNVFVKEEIYTYREMLFQVVLQH